MRRALRLLAITFGIALSGTLAGVLVLAGWIVGSSGGARWLVDWLPRAGLVQLSVGQVEGRLLGPLEIRDLVIELPALRLELDRARLDWRPGALRGRALYVAELSGNRLVLRLRQTPDAPDGEPIRVPQLPLSIRIDQARLARIEVHRPAPDPARAAIVIEAAQVQRLDWAGADASIERLAARHALGTFEAQVRARLGERHVDLAQLVLRRAGPQPMQLDARGRVQLDQNQDSALEVDWKDLRWPLEGAPLATSRQGHARIEGRVAGKLQLRAAFALGERAQVRADAQADTQDGRRRLAARLDWTELAWPLAGAPRLSSARGTATLDGDLAAFRYTLDARLAAQGRQGDARASGSGAADHIVIEALRLAVAGATVEGRGRVDWAPALRADADLRVRNLDPAILAPAWPGRLNGRVQARTRIDGNGTRVRFEVALKDSRLRGYPLQLDARGEARGAAVTLDALTAASGSTRLHGSGRVTPPFDARARLDSPDLAALWPGLRGRAQLDAQLRGAADAPRLVARGGVDALSYQTLALQRLRLDADLDADGAWRLDLDLAGLSGPAAVPQASLRVDGRAADHRLRAEVDAEAADLALGLRGAFDRVQGSWSGALDHGRAEPRGLPRWELEEPAALRASQQRVQLEPACWRAPDSRLCAQAIREPGRLRGAFRVEQFDFAYFRGFLPPGWDLSGGIDGNGMVELRDGRLSEARADLSTDPIEVRRDGEPLLRAEPGSLRLEEVGGRALARVDLPLHAGRIGFDGELAPGPGDFSARPLRGELRVSLQDLSFLRLLSEELTDVAGRVDGRMDWSGSLAAPRPQGELRLTDGRLRLATPNLDVTDLRARIASPDDDATLAIEASARSGGGSLDVRGRADLSAQPARVTLAFRGDEFQAANMAEARAWVSPRLDLEIANGRLDLRGEVEVPRAEITPPSFDSGIGPSGDQVIVRSGADADRAAAGLALHADVRLLLGRKVHFEGFGLKTRLEGAVRAIETPDRPASGRGEVRLVDGRYKAYGQDLSIASGRLLFNGGPLTEPAIEIRALRRPREDIEVGVLARGTLDRPEFQLFSTPAMPRERQLSWLVLGRSIEEGGSGDERAMLANAALSLGLTGTDFLAQNLRGGLGIDEVSIGAAPGAEAQEARFTVGKYLSPRLYVSYGVGLFQPGQVFKLLYELGRGFKVSTESGVQAGGDLLYSVER